MPFTLNPATLLSGRYAIKDIPDLSGRIAIVTGGSDGIGYYDALGLAQAGARVLIISATHEHGKNAEKEINDGLVKNGKKGSVEWYELDMGCLADTDKLSRRLADELPRLDILICNAAVGQAPYGLTKDGLARHFEINNLAHYVMVVHLIPLMEKTVRSGLAAPGTVRIVMQSSEAHRASPSDVKFATKSEIMQERDPLVMYGRTKLGLILLARQLVKRVIDPSTKILAISVHPGTVDTHMQSAFTESYGIVGSVLEGLSRLFGKSPQKGAEASLWAATSVDIKADNYSEYQGNYYSEAHGKPGTEIDAAKDETIGDNFWMLCGQLTREILGRDLDVNRQTAQPTTA